MITYQNHVEWREREREEGREREHWDRFTMCPAKHKITFHSLIQCYVWVYCECNQRSHKNDEQRTHSSIARKLHEQQEKKKTYEISNQSNSQSIVIRPNAWHEKKRQWMRKKTSNSSVIYVHKWNACPNWKYLIIGLCALTLSNGIAILYSCRTVHSIQKQLQNVVIFLNLHIKNSTISKTSSDVQYNVY